MGIRLAPKPLEIGPLDGFSKSDIFEAEQTGERLANFVSDLEGHSVIVFDGAWGTGKSVFVQQWAGLLRQRGHPVAYFDAFAHHHLDDAFSSLFTELLGARARDPRPSLHRFRHDLVQNADPLVRTIPDVFTDLAVRTGTASAPTTMGSRDGSERSDAEEKERVLVEECIAHVDNYKESLNQFSNQLERAMSEMKRQDGKRPLVFIVDELDRCRPAYAMSVLDRIKNVFHVDGVCFVFVTDLAELTAMVQDAYGVTDPNAYLHKFYHRRFDIGKILFRNRSVRCNYVDHLTVTHGIQDLICFGTLAILCDEHGVSLRGQERIVINCALLIGTMSSDEMSRVIAHVIPALAVMRHIDPTLFRLASSQELEFSRLMGFLKIDPDDRCYDQEIWWWRVASVDGFQHLSDGDALLRTALADDIPKDTTVYRSLLARMCLDLEQLSD